MRTRRRCAEPKVEQLCEGCCSKMPQFFKVLIGDFKERLRIPPAFMKHVAIKESGRAMLEDQFSRCWDIEILRVGNDMIFREGWDKFVERNDLETGDFLVFRYEGKLRFAVSIFDKSACQKEPNSRDISASPIVDLTHHENHGENRLPSSDEGKKRRDGPSNAWDVSSSFKSTNPTFKKVVTDPNRNQLRRHRQAGHPSVCYYTRMYFGLHLHKVSSVHHRVLYDVHTPDSWAGRKATPCTLLPLGNMETIQGLRSDDSVET
ncbi:unnamed protein product [Victoria cruziana]